MQNKKAFFSDGQKNMLLGLLASTTVFSLLLNVISEPNIGRYNKASADIKFQTDVRVTERGSPCDEYKANAHFAGTWEEFEYWSHIHAIECEGVWLAD